MTSSSSVNLRVIIPKISSIWAKYGNRVLSKNSTFSLKDMTDQLLEFKEILKSRPSNVRKIDKQTRKLLLYLFTNTRGGFTRLRITMHLLEQPYNTHQLAQELDLDYKAVQHHLKVLEKNNMVSKIGEKYGAIFHLSNFLEMNISALDEAIEKLDRKLNHKKVYL